MRTTSYRWSLNVAFYLIEIIFRIFAVEANNVRLCIMEQTLRSLRDFSILNVKLTDRMACVCVSVCVPSSMPSYAILPIKLRTMWSAKAK